MPKFAVNGRFSPSQLEGITSNQLGAELKLSTKIDGQRVASGLTEYEIKAFDALYAQDAALDDPTVDRVGGRVRTIDNAALFGDPELYLPLSEAGTFTERVSGLAVVKGAAITTWPSLAVAAETRTAPTFGGGAGSSITIASAAVGNPIGSASHSGSCWVTLGGLPSQTVYPMNRRINNADGFAFAIGVDGLLRYVRYVSAGSSATLIGSNVAAMGAGTYHLGFSYNGATRVAKVFVNGILARAATLSAGSSPLIDASANPFTVGLDADGVGAGLIGQIGAVAHYNYTLPDYHFRAQWAAGTYGPA